MIGRRRLFSAPFYFVVEAPLRASYSSLELLGGGKGGSLWRW